MPQLIPNTIIGPVRLARRKAMVNYLRFRKTIPNAFPPFEKEIADFLLLKGIAYSAYTERRGVKEPTLEYSHPKPEPCIHEEMK